VGGDNWSADAAIRYIENQSNWRGMMVSLGGIDKLGHMWGPEDRGERGAARGSVEEMRHLPFIAKNADKQVGRIVEALKESDQLDDTLIVITADHAAQTGREFHGVLAPGITNPLCSYPPDDGHNPDPPSTGIRSDCNWYLGSDADEIYRDPSPAVAELEDDLNGNLAFSYQDGHVAAWLTDRSSAKKREAADAVLDMPGVIASYRTNRTQDDYRLYGTNRMGLSERRWFDAHADELIDTMAHPSGPDVVGLLKTDVTYGVMGDHGGHNKLIQNIPMVFYGPGVSSQDSRTELRHVDVLPTILKTMGIPYDEADLDGEAVRVSRWR
jgi:arylsulfatase A-like enzyme